MPDYYSRNRLADDPLPHPLAVLANACLGKKSKHHSHSAGARHPLGNTFLMDRQERMDPLDRGLHRPRESRYSPQGRSPDEPLPLQGLRGQCAAVRNGPQHPLAVADVHQERPQPFVVPVTGERFGELV